MNNAEILARLDEAFKMITVSDLDESILVPQKFSRFVRAMQSRANILSEARFMKMDSQQADIDRVGFVGRILKSGTDAGGDHREISDTDDYAKPQFATNKLIAKELQAVCGIRDKALRRNIEKGGFENTLVDLFGEAAGRDLEEWCLLADTDIQWATDDVLSLTDGWIKLAVQKVYGDGDDADFDPTSDEWPENLFQAMLDALPKQFLQNRPEWRIWVPWEVEDDYRNLLKARETALGDAALIGNAPLFYKGIPVRYSPMIERSKTVAAGGAGRVALLGHPDNMAWGIFHEITVERDRKPRDRRTDFVLTVEGDSGYEDENAAVAAFIDQEAPSVS